MAIVNGSLQEGYKDAAWFAANPTLVLLVGQKVNLEQTGTYKLGDGTTQLSALSFLGGSGSGLSGLTTNKVLKATSSTTAGDSNITDDGTNVVVNGLKIRSISNATYFNASGVNGHYWNSFDDAINLFRVKNDGVVNIPQGTSDRIMALDTNKDVVYLSTTVYPSLTELSYGKGVTSAIQTQLDGKLNAINMFLTTGNQTTTSNVASNITDLVSPTLTANKRYRISGVIHFGCNNSGGVKYQITVPSGATLWVMGHSNYTNATTIIWTPILSSATLSPSFAGVSNADYGALCIDGEISIGATAGVIQFGFASATNTQTSTVYQLGTQLTLTQIN